MMSRRSFLRAAAGFTGLAAGLGYYTCRIEPEWLELVHRPLPIRRLPSSLFGRALARFSVLHVGPRVSDAYLLDNFRRVGALRPDIVVVTGDLMSWHDGAFDHLAAVYRHLPKGRLRSEEHTSELQSQR